MLRMSLGKVCWTRSHDQAHTMKLNPSAKWSDWKHVSRALLIEWLRPGGDWVDAAGVMHGPQPWITRLVTAASAFDIDIGAIDGDLLIRNSAVAAAAIDGVPAEAWYSSPSNDKSLPLPSTGTSYPVIVRNSARGRVLTLTPHANAVGKTLRIDKLSPPERPEFKPYVYAPDDQSGLIWKIPLKDEPTLVAWLTAHGYPVTPSDPADPKSYVYSPEFGIDPQYGFEYIRVASRTDEERLIAWVPRIEPPREEVWSRYLIMPEDDVFIGMTEAGMKQPGITVYTPSADTLSWRMWHGAVDKANPGILRFTEYIHAAGDDYSGHPLAPNLGVFLHGGKWNEIKLRGKVNSLIDVDPVTGFGTGLYDGISEIYVNGYPGLIDRARKWRNNTKVLWNALFQNIYHGGQNVYPSIPIHFRLAEMACYTSDPGATPHLFSFPPPEIPMSVRDHLVAARGDAVLIASPVLPVIDAAIAEVDALGVPSARPLWRQGKEVGKQFRIPGTKPRPPVWPNAGPLHWSMLLMAPDGRVYAFPGGHNSDSSLNGSNAIYCCNTFVDAPQGFTIEHSGTSAANVPDWSPAVLVDGSNRGPIDNWFYTKLNNRAHYDADAGDVAIRPSCQAYYGMQWGEAAHCFGGEERVFFISLQSPRSRLGGTHTKRQVDGFRTAAKRWDQAVADSVPYPFAGQGTKWGDIPPRNPSSNDTAEPVVCRDPRNGRIFYANRRTLHIFEPWQETPHWRQGLIYNGAGIYKMDSTWNGWNHHAMEVDPVRDRLFSIKPVGATQTARIEIYSASQGGSMTYIPITGLTLGTRTQIINNGNGLTCVPEWDCYVLLLSSTGPAPNGGVDSWWKVNPDNGKAEHMFDDTPGCYGRIQGGFKYVPALGGILAAQDVNRELVFCPTQ